MKSFPSKRTKVSGTKRHPQEAVLRLHDIIHDIVRESVGRGKTGADVAVRWLAVEFPSFIFFPPSNQIAVTRAAARSLPLLIVTEDFSPYSVSRASVMSRAQVCVDIRLCLKSPKSYLDTVSTGSGSDLVSDQPAIS